MEDYFSLARLNELLQAVRGLRVGVVGDLRLSGRWFTDAGQRTAAVVREAYDCAGAAHVADNLAALGLAQVRVFSVSGEDWRSAWLRKTLIDAGLDLSGVLLDPGWVTPLSLQVLGASASRQGEGARLDIVNTAELSLDIEEKLLAGLESALPDLDALVVADGQPISVISAGMLEGLNEMAAGAGRIIFTVDSCERTGQFSNMVRKLSRLEAARWLFPEREPDSVGLQEFAEAALYPQVDCGCPLFITLGEQGCLVLEGGESHLAQPGPVSLDTAEAGETFLAALTAALAVGASSLEAVRLGELAAAAAAGKPGGRGVASPADLLEAYGGDFAAGR